MQRVTFSDLPPNIVETIFINLSYSDINRMRSTSKFFYNACGAFLKYSIMDTKHELHQYMRIINTHFLTQRLLLDEKSILLRAYNTLEILNLSLNMLIILNRHILERNDTCLPIGFVLNGFQNIISSMKKNMFGPWPTLGMNLHNRMRHFMECMEKCEPKLKNVIPLGSRTMDLIDTLMDAYYEICVIYDIPSKFCYITGHYRLGDSRFLSYLPDISFLNDCHDRELSEEEADILMKYLVLLVNVHNGLLTKSEQYRRDLEFARSISDSKEHKDVKHCLESLKKSKQVYSPSRVPVYREVIDKRGEVVEMYVRTEPELVTDNGVKCYIQLQCNIDEAPLQIKKSFDNLENDIKLGNKSVENMDPTIFDVDGTSSKSYGVTVKLEIRLPYNNPQMVDLKFSDGINLNLT